MRKFTPSRLTTTAWVFSGTFSFPLTFAKIAVPCCFQTAPNPSLACSIAVREGGEQRAFGQQYLSHLWGIMAADKMDRFTEDRGQGFTSHIPFLIEGHEA